MRRLTAASWVALAAALVPGSPVGAGDPAPVDLAERAYTVEAEAYPTEPAPGSQDQAVAVRPNSSRAEVVNPPVDAYARAAQSDLGLAEGYVGPQGRNAEADTTAPNSPQDVTVDADGAHLEARVTRAPFAEALAEGSIGEPTGSGSSYAMTSADGVLVAVAEAEVKDLLVGPLLIGQGRFEARVEVDGTRGGAVADGRIVLSETSVNGIPVVLGADGVAVDESRIPASQVATASEAVQTFFAQGGYSDIRVVQPRASVSDDGSRAEVAGGGVRLHFTNNDPTNRYFVTYTLLGGRASASLGAPFDVVGAPVVPPSSDGAGPPSAPATGATAADGPGAGPTPGGDTDAAPAAEAPADDETAALGVDLTYLDDTTTVALPTIWPYWPWVLAAGAVLIGASTIGLRDGRVRRRVEALADGYLRG